MGLVGPKNPPRFFAEPEGVRRVLSCRRGVVRLEVDGVSGPKGPSAFVFRAGGCGSYSKSPSPLVRRAGWSGVEMDGVGGSKRNSALVCKVGGVHCV